MSINTETERYIVKVDTDQGTKIVAIYNEPEAGKATQMAREIIKDRGFKAYAHNYAERQSRFGSFLVNFTNLNVPLRSHALHIDSEDVGRIEYIGWGSIANVTFNKDDGEDIALQALVNQANLLNAAIEACKQAKITLDPMDNDHAKLYRQLSDVITKAEQV